MSPGLRAPARGPGSAAASACHASSLVLAALARHARQRPREPAIVELKPQGHITVTWSQLRAAATARAGVLARALIVGQPAPSPSHASTRAVIVPIGPGAEMVAWMLACWLAGVRALPVHPSAAGTEGPAAARLAGATALIVPTLATHALDTPHAQLADDAAAAMILARAVGMVAPPSPSAPSSRLAAVGSVLTITPPHTSELPIQDLSPGVLLSTSGSTGQPKLALRTLPALDADAAQIAQGLALTQHDAVLAVMPLNHSYGIDVLVGCVLSGAALWIAHPMDASVVASALRSGVTVLPGVPFIFEALARAGPVGGPCAEPITLRAAVSAGAPLPQRVERDFLRAWGVPIGQLYGSTELGTVLVHLAATAHSPPPAPPDDHELDTPEAIGACVGTPLAGVSVKVVSLDTPAAPVTEPVEPVEAGPGEVGELYVRAPSMLAGSIEPAGPPAHALRTPAGLIPPALTPDGYLPTGDLALIDDRGRVHLRGRRKLLIDVGGIKVNPLEVESALLVHPRVQAAAVVGVAQSDTVQRLRAIIVVQAGEPAPSTAELRALLRTSLASAKIPRRFDRAESLPVGPGGKLRRELLASWPVTALGRES